MTTVEPMPVTLGEVMLSPDWQSCAVVAEIVDYAPAGRGEIQYRARLGAIERRYSYHGSYRASPREWSAWEYGGPAYVRQIAAPAELKPAANTITVET